MARFAVVGVASLALLCGQTAGAPLLQDNGLPLDDVSLPALPQLADVVPTNSTDSAHGLVPSPASGVLETSTDSATEIIRPPMANMSLGDEPVDMVLGDKFSAGNIIKVILGVALDEVPHVGGVLSAMLDLFWPEDKEDVWSEIKDQVEHLVSQKLAQNVYENVKNHLVGLKNSMTLYVHAVNDSASDVRTISDYYITTNSIFTAAAPHFQSDSYRLLLLPLFTQFANMHLSLLRDAALFGGQWQMTPDWQNRAKADLSTTINAYANYANSVYSNGLKALHPGTNFHNCEPYRTTNEFIRGFTMSTLDFVNLWQYMDVTKYPSPVKVDISGEIYGPPVGTCDDTGLQLPGPAKMAPTRVTVWAYDRLDALQVNYPNGGGPGGRTATARMGNPSGGQATSPPYGGVFDLTQSGPIVAVGGTCGDIINSIWFQFQNGQKTGPMGTKESPTRFFFGLPGYYVSSLYVPGASRAYGSANALVVGFKLAVDSVKSDLKTIRTLFVSSPTSTDAISTASRLGVTDPQVLAAVEQASGQWQQQRDELWANRAVVAAQVLQAQGVAAASTQQPTGAAQLPRLPPPLNS